MGYCLVSGVLCSFCFFKLSLGLLALSSGTLESSDLQNLLSLGLTCSVTYKAFIYLFILCVFLLLHSHMMKSPFFFHLPTWLRIHLEVDRLMQNSLVIYRAVGVVAWVSFSLLPSIHLSFPFPFYLRCNYPSSVDNELTSFFLLLTVAQNALFVTFVDGLINCIVSLRFTPRVGFHSIRPLSFAVLLSFSAQNH